MEARQCASYGESCAVSLREFGLRQLIGTWKYLMKEMAVNIAKWEKNIQVINPKMLGKVFSLFWFCSHISLGRKIVLSFKWTFQSDSFKGTHGIGIEIENDTYKWILTMNEDSDQIPSNQSKCRKSN